MFRYNFRFITNYQTTSDTKDKSISQPIYSQFMYGYSRVHLSMGALAIHPEPIVESNTHTHPIYKERHENMGVKQCYYITLRSALLLLQNWAKI